MGKKLTNEEFLKRVWSNNKGYRDGEFKILSRYVSAVAPIIVEDKYGKLKTSPGVLVAGWYPRISSALDKQSYFKNTLLDKNIHYKSGMFEIVGQYINHKTPILIRDNYGMCKVKVYNILEDQRPTIASAVDRTNYFMNKLIERNTDYKEGRFKITGEYVNASTKILIKTQYGQALVQPSNLLNDYSANILSAVDKTSYWINMAKEIHGDRYDYSEVEYVGCKRKVTILCPTHGTYKQEPREHLRGCGCQSCGTPNWHRKDAWVRSGLNSGHFKSYKFYLIKFTHKTTGEQFIKCGITFRRISSRFSEYSDYDREVLRVVERFDKQGGEYIHDLEKRFLGIFKHYKYKPDGKFDGASECFQYKAHK